MKNVFEVIKKDFKNTGKGYKIYAKELFAPDYGIPQSRKRIFFIGISEEFIKRNKLNLISIQQVQKVISKYKSITSAIKSTHFKIKQKVIK